MHEIFKRFKFRNAGPANDQVGEMLQRALESSKDLFNYIEFPDGTKMIEGEHRVIEPIQPSEPQPPVQE